MDKDCKVTVFEHEPALEEARAYFFGHEKFDEHNDEFGLYS
jgi:hypothetical protein